MINYLGMYLLASLPWATFVKNNIKIVKHNEMLSFGDMDFL